jgi:hypothetical protein
MPNLEKLVEHMTDKWAETHYRRLSDQSINPLLAEFLAYYRSIAGERCGDFGPRWEDFQLIDIPRKAIQFIAVAGAVYADPQDALPDHFVYHLQGRGVDMLIGEDMKGRRVGRVMRQMERNSLEKEISEVLETGQPVFSHARLALPERSDVVFHRGLFLFSDARGRPDRLILYLQKELCKTLDIPFSPAPAASKVLERQA